MENIIIHIERQHTDVHANKCPFFYRQFRRKGQIWTGCSIQKKKENINVTWYIFWADANDVTQTNDAYIKQLDTLV